jgi:predicted glycoside hydrolase/deacetylase ChbG (UPF0249 family)
MTVLEGLGFSTGDRAVVVHVDDLGMSPSANVGGVQALDGAATCGSVMVPCPAFEQMAEIARGRPELDIGVHLTLNAEYENYRWGPIVESVPGLVSPDGGMWRTTAETVDHASAEEVDRELRAQIDRALEAGIDVTHLDSHMGTVFNPKFVDVYVALAREYRLPAFIPRISGDVLQRADLPANVERYVSLIDDAEKSGFPIFDHFNSDSLEFPPGTGANHNRARVDGFTAGVAYLITHCAQGGDELQSIAPDWRQRDEERQIYSDGTMAQHFEATQVHTLGMRPLRDWLRGRL